jgi:hypothetical protein
MKHLGRHLEEIALFVVPHPDEDDGTLKEIGSNEVHINDDDDNDSVSALSSFRSVLSAREEAYAKFTAHSTLQSDEIPPTSIRQSFIKRGDPPQAIDGKYYCNFSPDCADLYFDRKNEWR